MKDMHFRLALPHTSPFEGSANDLWGRGHALSSWSCGAHLRLQHIHGSSSTTERRWRFPHRTPARHNRHHYRARQDAGPTERDLCNPGEMMVILPSLTDIRLYSSTLGSASKFSARYAVQCQRRRSLSWLHLGGVR